MTMLLDAVEKGSGRQDEVQISYEVFVEKKM
jgi:hypothetical protein